MKKERSQSENEKKEPTEADKFAKRAYSIRYSRG